ncbi:Fructosamine kinase [Marinobacter antarcticus]|uniref:Fructosamine kinase n=1 Tax=Marinobacter antarcticus TaxID=564117 RepID=A0A1M6U6B7_9GAMM|nr:fructosamine kinase family protein [Marinobacter antarcticus]SHK64710.1 Fructosamine kinase [Marinobacter antarcticus]
MAGVFTKHNGAGYADALICEAEGLDSLRAALRDAGVFCIRVPEVRSVGETEMEIEAIDSGAATTATFQMLGDGLAQMHKSPKLQYGWGGDNYIGLSPQPNRWSATWVYHYLNHYNLFGSGYLEGCRRGFLMVKQVAGHL